MRFENFIFCMFVLCVYFMFFSVFHAFNIVRNENVCDLKIVNIKFLIIVFK